MGGEHGGDWGGGTIACKCREEEEEKPAAEARKRRGEEEVSQPLRGREVRVDRWEGAKGRWTWRRW